MRKKKNLKSLDNFISEKYGKHTSSGKKLDKGFEEFKIGYLLQEARIKKGLTQEELAELSGTNKGYISRIENNLKEVRISTLQRIVETGLGGKLELSIRL